jgi:CheY-like chemotaxis protein
MELLRALVVDDEPAVCELFARTLRGVGMNVFVATSGRAALTLAQTVVPQIVVTDVQMPDLDGLALCRRLRTDPALRTTLIVVVTGEAASQRDQAISAGCDAVLAKPCSQESLLATIRLLFKKSS